jgi:hypothetical protein
LAAIVERPAAVSWLVTAALLLQSVVASATDAEAGSRDGCHELLRNSGAEAALKLRRWSGERQNFQKKDQPTVNM